MSVQIWRNSASTRAERPFWASCGQIFQCQMGRLDALLTVLVYIGPQIFEPVANFRPLFGAPGAKPRIASASL